MPAKPHNYDRFKPFGALVVSFHEDEGGDDDEA
jgi:hypothetical protein